MPRVTVYSSAFCGYCYRAKKLLQEKGVAFEDVDVMMNPARKAEMIARAGGRHTVPQIFIDDRHVGGCDELHALEREGKLDPLLQEAS